MYSPSNFGLSADILKVVSSVMEEGRRITKENLAEQVASGVWNIEGQTGSVVSVYDTSSRTRFKLEVLDEMKMKNSDAALKLKKEISSLETSISKLTPLARKDDAANMKLVAAKKRLEAKKAEHSKLMKEEVRAIMIGETNKNDKSDDGEGLDAVQPKEVKKKFADRKDKDIDNDGDTDSSDEYLHRRRKAISKAMEEVELDEAQKLFMFKTKQEADKKAKEIKGKVIELGPKNFAVVTKDLTVIEEVELDELSKKTLGSYVKGASQDIATKSAATGRYAERANKASDDMKKTGDYSQYTQKRKDDETADKMFNKSWKRRLGVAKAVDKLTKEEQELDELSKKTLGSYVKKAGADNLSLGVGLSRAANDSDNFRGSKNLKTLGRKASNRTVGINRAADKLTKEEVELDEAKMEAAVEKTQADINHAQKYMKAADNQGDVIKHMNRLSMLRKQLSYQKAKLKEAKETDAEMEDEDGDGEKDKKKKKGKFEKYDIVNTKPSDNKTMMQTDEETILEIAGKKLTSFEKEKFDELKKKHENNKTHRLLRKQYGDKGDDIFHGKLIKMAKGTYDGTHSKNEELELDELSTTAINTYVSRAKRDTDASGESKRKKGIQLALKKKWGGKVGGTEAPRVPTTEEVELDEDANVIDNHSRLAKAHGSHAKDIQNKLHDFTKNVTPKGMNHPFVKETVKDYDTLHKFHKDAERLHRKAIVAHKSNDVSKHAISRAANSISTKLKNSGHFEGMSENFELDEQDQPVKRGRGRPRKDAAASSETTDSGDRHIVNQMRKAVSLNGHHVVFDNGEKKHVDRVTAQAFINKYNGLDKPMHKEIISKSAIKSHEHFKNALKGKVEAPKSNKIDMPKLKSDVMIGKY
jgi:hypothetical protein